MVVSFIGREVFGRVRLRTGLLRMLLAPGLIIIVFSIHAALFSGSAAAQVYTNPHSGFSNSTRLCLICHGPHEAPGAKLLRGTPESALCFTCHNGTGSNFNIETQMNLNPSTNAMHPIFVNLANNNGLYNYTPNTTAGIAPLGPYNCSQCHNPHGDSGYGRLLRGRYETMAYVTYSPNPDSYQACWSCHSTASIINDTTYFSRHNSHIITHQAPCIACHYSPHGVPSTELVRFNPSFVTASLIANSGPTFVDGGNHTGSCTLSCHGADHNNVNY